MKFLALLLCLPLLCACAEAVYKPVDVDVPVTVPCTHEKIAHPDFPLKNVPTTATVFDKTKAALLEIDYRKIYEDQLNAALTACGG